MLFDTPIYFVFLIIVTATYWRLKHRAQNYFLLIASYFFYGWWDWRFLFLILISTVVDFISATYIARSTDSRHRRALLVLSLSLNFGFLGVFKYYDFFVDSLVSLLSALHLGAGSAHFLRIILPPGISFYTFQEVAYIVDVYKGKLKPANSLVDYALFISLFPHLIAGPIQRPAHLLPQVQTQRPFLASRFFDGLLLILSGLFRKCVIADNCALVADAAFSGTIGEPSFGTLVVGVTAFAWQIYADFSGYSDIARGSAQLLGFHFMVNFRQPYLATSLQEFWRRWHISLSTWLRDYLYVPLGGNRHGTLQTYRNLMVTMLLGGLWHGANWTFVIWGAIHGIGLSVERLFWGERNKDRVPSARTDGPNGFIATVIARVVVFHLVCFSWIFFRASNLGEAGQLLRGLFHLVWLEQHTAAAMFVAIFAGTLMLFDLILERRQEEYPLQHSPISFRVAAATACLLVILMFSANQSNAFIYFQF